MPELADLVGERLRRARESAGLTQQQAASIVGITREELSYHENGRREISLGRLARLANLYGYTVDYFLRDEDSSPESHVAIAFRAENVSEPDLEVIAWAKKLVVEAHELDCLLGGDER